MQDQSWGTFALNLISGLALLFAASWFSYTFFSGGHPKADTTVIIIQKPVIDPGT